VFINTPGLAVKFYLLAILLELINRDHAHVLLQEWNIWQIKVKYRDKQEPEE